MFSNLCCLLLSIETLQDFLSISENNSWRSILRWANNMSVLDKNVISKFTPWYSCKIHYLVLYTRRKFSFKWWFMRCYDVRSSGTQSWATFDKRLSVTVLIYVADIVEISWRYHFRLNERLRTVGNLDVIVYDEGLTKKALLASVLQVVWVRSSGDTVWYHSRHSNVERAKEYFYTLAKTADSLILTMFERRKDHL